MVITKADINMWAGEAAQGDAGAKKRLAQAGYRLELLPDDSGGALAVLYQTGECACIALDTGGESVLIDYKPKSYSDEIALGALGLIRSLTGMDYTEIIRRLMRDDTDIAF